MKRVVVLGSTGSIGTQALEVMDERRVGFRVTGLAAGGSQLALLARQTVAFQPQAVAIAGRPERRTFLHPILAAAANGAAGGPTGSGLSQNVSTDDAEVADDFRRELALAAEQAGVPVPHPEIAVGAQAVTDLAARADLADIVLNGITGAAGLLATLATLRVGLRLALANKESLVIGGPLVTRAASSGQLVAVDSEHSAIAQCLRGGETCEVRRLILTASGGPFRGWTRAQMAEVTPAQAMAHPTWHMGTVITINSATLVNKGLELLEAALLYGVDIDRIQVVVHPQSVVHSGVEFVDGACILQASPPDMKLPIALALGWPQRLVDAVPPCDWTKAAQWTFEPVDEEAFPAIGLARRAGRAQGTAPAVLNGANEVCVEAFCAGRLGFLGICDTIAAVLDEHLAPDGAHVTSEGLTLDAVLRADAWARQAAARRIGL